MGMVSYGVRAFAAEMAPAGSSEAKRRAIFALCYIITIWPHRCLAVASPRELKSRDGITVIQTQK